MKRTLGESRAYARGYSAGQRCSWPDHKPPIPPHAVLSPLIKAARELRDSIDGVLTEICADDEWSIELGPHIETFDQANESLTKWLTNLTPAP